MKVCPKCGEQNHPANLRCGCGHEFRRQTVPASSPVEATNQIAADEKITPPEVRQTIDHETTGMPDIILNTFWPLFGFFGLMTLWFAYDGWFNPEVQFKNFNRIGALLFLLPTAAAAWLTFRHESANASPESALPSGHHSQVDASMLEKWNWGAFLLSPLWGPGHRVYLGLLSVIPLVGLVFAVVLGLRGNRWAWEKNRWSSPDHFRSVQRLWAYWGVGFSVCAILFSVASFL